MNTKMTKIESHQIELNALLAYRALAKKGLDKAKYNKRISEILAIYRIAFNTI